MERADEFSRSVGVQLGIRRQDDFEANKFAPNDTLISSLAERPAQARADRQTGEDEEKSAADNQ
jgi:hypothetical protein